MSNTFVFISLVMDIDMKHGSLQIKELANLSIIKGFPSKNDNPFLLFSEEQL